MATHRLLQVGELELGAIRSFELEGKQFVLAYGEQGPVLVDGRCPHAGGDLAHGDIIGNRIRCPTHRYLFDLATGDCAIGRREGWGPLGVYPLEEIDGYLCVRI